jgi:hypothetical protein
VYWIADGHHRVAAARLAGLETIEASVHLGNERAALFEATAANKLHGLRRSRADKRRAVRILLSDPKWAAMSDRAIAEHVGVSHPFVAGLRPIDVTCSEPSESEVPALEPKAEPTEREREPVPDVSVESVTLPNEERAPFDAYYTPLVVSVACCRWLRDRGLTPKTIAEPSVGGGAWVTAAAQVWGDEVEIDRYDIDPSAPGLRIEEGNTSDHAYVQDWLSPTPYEYDLVLGNRPYSGDLAAWVETSLQRADWVALLERESITGSLGRLEWWQGHRPAFIAKVIAPKGRPLWEGPGARLTPDLADSVLIVWEREAVRDTRWDWIDARGTRS